MAMFLPLIIFIQWFCTMLKTGTKHQTKNTNKTKHDFQLYSVMKANTTKLPLPCVWL